MPTQWAHGDTTTEAKLDGYSTALNTIHGQLGDVVCQALTPAAEGSGARFFNVHLQRWLHFRGTGDLLSSDHVHSIGLSDVDNGWTALDLDGVEWLNYGEIYEVEGVTACCEDWEP